MERRGGHTHQHDRLQTLVRTRRGFVVFDPRIVRGTHYAIDDQGTLVYDRVPAGATVAFVGAVAAVGALLLGDDWGWRAVWFAVGIPVGAALAGLLLALIHLVNSPERRYRRSTGSSVFSTAVDGADAVGWRTCVLASQIADSRAWRSGVLDPDRLLAPVLWSAIGLTGGGPAGRDAAAERAVVESCLAAVAEVAVEVDGSWSRRPLRLGVSGAGPETIGDAAADHAEKMLAQAHEVREHLRA